MSGEKIVVSGFRHFFQSDSGPVQATGAIDLTIRESEVVTLDFGVFGGRPQRLR